ncbi:MAG: aldo/keto reductase [Methyloligellaceae bacterium]
MKTRRFGKTDWQVSEIGFGAWAIGGAWGDVSEKDAEAALNAALDSGVNLVDTADVYGDGRSETIISNVLKSRKQDNIKVLTKLGRGLSPHIASGFNKANLEGFINRSLKKLDVDKIDLIQLHCPPTEVYYMPEVFDFMDDFVKAGKICHYGVSVEKVEEALKAIEYPSVVSVQLIFNILRQRPAELLFELAKKKDIALLARVPLASGLLSGKFDRNSTFADDDHRKFNRYGEAFDVGETFAGIPFEVGLEVIEELRKIIPDQIPMSQYALKWILMHDAVSCVIPGAKNEEQATGNSLAQDLPALDGAQMQAIKKLYESKVKPLVHYKW